MQNAKCKQTLARLGKITNKNLKIDFVMTTAVVKTF